VDAPKHTPLCPRLLAVNQVKFEVVMLGLLDSNGAILVKFKISEPE
jgi:hypothetical protein